MCGAIQKESRPMMVCHWISHWTPQLASTFAATSPQSAARRHASDAPLTAAPAPETLMASTLMLMARQPSLPSRSRRRQDLAGLVQVVDGVQAPADDRVRLPVELLDPRERARGAARVLHVDDHHERRPRVRRVVRGHGAEGPQHLAVQAPQLTDQPRPRPEERRPGLERGRDRLAGRAAPGEETPELVEARAVGLDEVVHDLV